MQLREVEYEYDELIKEILGENPIQEVLREYQIVPPAITTTGARSVMKRLCEATDL